MAGHVPGGDEPSMSLGDLKARLQSSMRNSGVVDSLKAKLRHHLLQDLKGVSGKENIDVGAAPTSMEQRAANSLIIGTARRSM